MTVEDDAEKVIERSADSKGRVTIGSEYAGEPVRVAVLGSPGYEHPEGVPERCADCGGALGGKFVYHEGEALHLGCAGVEDGGSA